MERNLITVMLAILLGSVVVGFNFIYSPKMKELRLLEEALREENEKRVLLNETVELETKIAAYRERGMPVGKEEIELLDRIREIASEAQVRVTSMVPQEKIERGSKEGYRKFSLTISFEGTYHNLGDFIAHVEHAEKTMKIEALRFATIEPGQPFLRCEVTLSVFSIP